MNIDLENGTRNYFEIRSEQYMGRKSEKHEKTVKLGTPLDFISNFKGPIS